MPLPRFSAAIFSFCLLFVALSRLYTAVPVSTPAADCGLQAHEVETAAAPAAIQLQVWGGAHGQNCWRVFGPTLAAQQITNQNIRVQATTFETLYRVYTQAFVQAAERNAAPDLANGGITELVSWGEAGYITPFDDCLARHPQLYRTIPQSLWTTQRWGGHVWGAPIQNGVQILFFSKVALHRLGWSNEQIADLPRQIQEGQFTLADLLAVAKEAIAAGVVQPGYAFWPAEREIHFFQLIYTAYADRLYDPVSDKLVISQAALTATFTFARTLLAEKLAVEGFAGDAMNSWFNNNLRRDALVQNRVLFWVTSKGEWAEWERNYTKELGGVDHLYRSIGYALFPPVQRGVAGHVLWHGTDYYVLATAQATGHNRQMATCDVLAQTLTPAMNARLVMKSGNLGVLSSPTAQAAYRGNRFAAETAYLWRYAKPDYNRHATLHLWLKDGAPYQTILLDALEQAERGELSPAAAATSVADRLRGLLGDRLLVE